MGFIALVKSEELQKIPGKGVKKMKKRIFLFLAVIAVAVAAVVAISVRKEPKKVTSRRAKFVWQEDPAEDILLQQGKCEDEICIPQKEEEFLGY